MIAQGRGGSWGSGGLARVVLAAGLGLVACLPPELPLPQPRPPGEESAPPRPTPRPPGEEPVPPRPTPSPIPSPDGHGRYLKLSLEQLRRLDRKIPKLGAQREAAGALTAGALFATGHSTREEVERYVGAALVSCSGRWHQVSCERAELNLQRLILQYPESLPPPLRSRLRREVTQGAPPPGPAAIQNPWDFPETENQRMVKMARSLVGLRIAGAGESAAARAWAEYARAFLLAHDRNGWYEGDSPGYLAISMTALLHLADHAPDEGVRDLAARQLHLLFAAWAQKQVGGFPAGPKTRTPIHWALGPGTTPWQAWAWLASGVGDPARINFMDFPELAVSHYRIPEPVTRLLIRRRLEPPYEIRESRRISPPRRRNVRAALYSYATPEYILGVAQAVRNLRLGISGGQEIVATLYPEGPDFAPVYFWSRRENVSRNWSDQDLAVGHRNLLLARLGRPESPDADLGHVYLAPPWSQPVVERDLVTSRYAGTYVALWTVGGWEVAPAGVRLPGLYGGPAHRNAWVAVPRRQPAVIAAEVGWRGEAGDFPAWKERVSAARLSVEGSTLRYRASDGTVFRYQPGEWATVQEQRLAPETYPLLEAPFLASPGGGRWRFRFEEVDYGFPMLDR